MPMRPRDLTKAANGNIAPAPISATSKRSRHERVNDKHGFASESARPRMVEVVRLERKALDQYRLTGMARDHIRLAGITSDRQQIDGIDCIEIDRAELIEEGVRRREHPAEREELIAQDRGVTGRTALAAHIAVEALRLG